MHTATITTKSEPGTATILPVVTVIFLGFLSIGIPFAALPNYVRGQLGFGNVLVGLVMGVQSLVTLLTRHYAGTFSDLKGPKPAVIRGLGISVVSGILSSVSLSLQPAAALGILLVARAVLGLGESLLITGALAWGVGALGPGRTGRIMAWSGIATYASIAVSAPISLSLDRQFGFSAVIAATVLAPALAGVIAWMTPGTPAPGKERLPFYRVIHRVWKAGAGLSLSAVGFAGLAGFAVLYFRHRGWENASLVMTVFGISFVLARIFFGHTPDQYGGKRVGLAAAAIEATGQMLLWLAPSPAVAFAGAALTGFGYSLVFPAFGVEAVRQIEPRFAGVALGAYVAFFDLALGVTGPLAGLVANRFGYAAVYLSGALMCIISALIAWGMPGRRTQIPKP